MRPASRRVLLTGLIACASLCDGLAFAGELMLFSTGQGDVSVNAPALRGTSGVTHLGEGRFVTVDDIDKQRGQPRFHELELFLDGTTTRITQTRVVASIPIEEGSQFEGIAYDERANHFYLASEQDHSVRVIDRYGTPVGMVPVPEIYRQAQPNRSLESLAFDRDRGELWIANEERLTVDDQVNAVRLQRFVAGQPEGQFVYSLESPRNPEQGFNGLVALEILPNGKLFALERDLDLKNLNIAIRCFEVTWSNGTDVSQRASLNDQQWTSVTKRNLLDPQRFPRGFLLTVSNYESVAIGPRQTNGSWPLLLGPSDDNDNGFLIPETIRVLRLSEVNE